MSAYEHLGHQFDDVVIDLPEKEDTPEELSWKLHVAKQRSAETPAHDEFIDLPDDYRKPNWA